MLLSHEELFLLTIEDLRTKINKGTPYDLVRACGLCRHLLIDGYPLYFRLTRFYRAVPLFFEVADYSNHPISKIRMTVGWTTIVPNDEVPTKKVEKDEFLSIVLLTFHNLEYTVLDIIRAASHFYGGIHSFKPENNKEGH